MANTMESDHLSDHNNDLPLLANVDDIRVVHYMINLHCDFNDNCFSGCVMLFCRPVESNNSELHSQHVTVHNCDDPAEQNTPCCLENLASYADASSECDVTGNVFKCVLDCCDIVVHQVEEILECDREIDAFLLNTEKKIRPEIIEEWVSKPRRPLCHSVEEWCLKIWKPGILSKLSFPRVLLVSYSTMSKGASLCWTRDQDGNKCVYTPAAWINNRSFVPCQEPPIAMATWQAKITVPKGYVVLMTGDKNPLTVAQNSSCHTFYYYTVMLLPVSTVAIAVGKWWHSIICEDMSCSSEVTSSYSQDIGSCDSVYSLSKFKGTHSSGNEGNGRLVCGHDSYPCFLNKTNLNKIIPCRLFAPFTIINKAKKEFKTYICACLEAAYALLGPHPFQRLDILVVPRNFANLGLASPNLVFISQTVVAGDGTMSIRLAHEVSHSWFGLLIGALDWTEEWLSEGFATYMEDLIHSAAMKIVHLTSKKCRRGRCSHEYCSYQAAGTLIKWSHVAELRACLRYKTLKAELENVESELQVLKPCNDDEGTVRTITYVKNGMNPLKSFTQVHYLKGYFLLRYMAYFVGTQKFVKMLKSYALKYHGQLVRSSDFLEFYCGYFQEVASDLNVREVFRQWLEVAGIPATLGLFCIPSQENSLYYAVKCHYCFWQHSSLSRNDLKLIDTELKVQKLPHLTSDQLSLLLEMLLTLPEFSLNCVKALIQYYHPQKKNADVRHRICELIVRSGHKTGLSVVRNFLEEDQGMGVYLYGELLIKGGSYANVATTYFKKLKDEMDPSSRVIVEGMINGDRYSE